MTDRPDTGATAGADDPALREALAGMWATGDYARVAEPLAASSEAFLDRLGVRPGERLLDVACGTGQIAIPAARRGAEVTGLDLTEAWLDVARSRAAAEGLEIRFDQGDAEAMPYPDAVFDRVVSLIGAMFAPDPARAASELARVCRPGGSIAMGNWTAEGFVGAFFGTVARHVPPPEIPSPLLWGDEATVADRLGAHAAGIEMRRAMLRFDYPTGPRGIVDHYAEHFGPVATAFAALDGQGRAALAADLEALFETWGEPAADGGMTVDAEILEVLARRA